MTITLGLLPATAPPWRQILEVLLPLRACIERVEKKSAVIQMVEIRTTLAKMENTLRKLQLSPPSMQSDPLLYLDFFSNWLLKTLQPLTNYQKKWNIEISALERSSPLCGLHTSPLN